MTNDNTPKVVLTQPKVSLALSMIALGGLIYTVTDSLVRYQIEFEDLKSSYVELSEGQKVLKSEMAALRNTVDGEIRHMTNAIHELSRAVRGDQ